MPRSLRVALFGLLACLALLALAWGIGTRLPVGHSATVSRELPILASTVWASISHLEGWPRWRRGVEKVERLPDRDGKLAYRETGANGPLVYVVEAMEPPTRLVLRVVDNPDFGGTWTYELASTGHGSRLAITEDGEIYDPLFRFLARYAFGYTGALEGYLDDLANELRLGLAAPA